MAVHYDSFRCQRLVVLSAMFIGWLLYNFCHKVFAASMLVSQARPQPPTQCKKEKSGLACETTSMPDLISHRDLEKTDLGAIASIFNIFYGISKLVVDIILI